MSDLATFVLNLDRHPARLQKMVNQLSDQGLQWERYPAIDAAKLSPADLDKLVAPAGPIPRMPLGARACTASHIAMLGHFLQTEASHALILEDDAELAPEMGRTLRRILDEGGVEILNINRQTPRGQDKRLVVGRRSRLYVNGQSVYDLVGIHYGTAGYVISRTAAQAVLKQYQHPNMPIDHILFNPNVSRLFGTVRIEQLFPALVQPRESEVSSIQNVPVAGSGKLQSRLKRAKAELSIAPRLLVGLAFGRYQVKTLDFSPKPQPKSSPAHR